MSNQVQRFERVQAECLALYKLKNERYGNSFESTLDSWGLTPIGIRLEDKLNRLRELIKRPDLETADESLRDTLVDIANYATMAVSYLDREGAELANEGLANTLEEFMFRVERLKEDQYKGMVSLGGIRHTIGMIGKRLRVFSTRDYKGDKSRMLIEKWSDELPILLKALGEKLGFACSINHQEGYIEICRIEPKGRTRAGEFRALMLDLGIWTI